ncbi:MAG: TolC family protein [Bacteroidales bacterium]
MRIRIYTSALLLFTGVMAFSQETYTLQDCIKRGLENNFQVQIQQERQTISDNNATIGNAGYLPKLDLNGGYNGQLNNSRVTDIDGVTGDFNDESSQSANAGLNMSWTLFDGLKIQATYEKLKELRSVGQLNTRITLENTAADISSAYYQLIRQKIRLKNLKAALALSKERLRIVEERYHLGSASRLELQQARVDYNADNTRYLKQTESVYQYIVLLNELMANPEIQNNLCIADESILLIPLADKETLWERTLQSNLSLLALDKEKKLSEEDLRIAQSRNYPYLKLNAGYGYTSNWNNSNEIKQREQLGFNYGATIGVTLFDGLNRRREQRNAKAQIRISELQKQSFELALKADMSNLWVAYKNNLQLLDLESQNVETAKEYLEIAMDRYKLGDLSGIELREAQNSLLAAEERFSTAEFETKLCEISLMQLSGDLLGFLLKD